MKFYVATALANHAQHNRIAERLSSRGHELTYDWTVHGPVRDKGLARIREVVELEARGVREADVVVVVLAPAGMATFARGTHAELGMAIANGIEVVLLSPDERVFGATKETCAFYHHPLVRWARTEDEAIALVEEMQ